jgi:hypothetical protein
MLVWSGSVVAGELKVMVPVDELKQMKSRLEALERENSQIRQGGAAAGIQQTNTPGSSELQGRLQAMESENSRLRQELNAAKGQPRQGDKSSDSVDGSLVAKLNAAENENIKLQQEVKTLKEGGLAAVFSENKISARELYFLQRKKGINHAYKF